MNEKYLILCEGTNEETIINMLLNNNKLCINKDNLLGLKPYHARQISNPTIHSEIRSYNKPIIIWRIGDKMNEHFPIPKELKHIVSKERIFKFCTKPELEMLLIINEHLEKEFSKFRDKKPKIFAKENIVYNKRKYDQTNDFFKLYYENRINVLVKNIKDYKSYKTHDNGEGFLADILADN